MPSTSRAPGPGSRPSPTPWSLEPQGRRGRGRDHRVAMDGNPRSNGFRARMLEHLLRLEDDLSRSVFRHRITRVVPSPKAIMTAKAGLADPDRPTGVFLFMGPTGVGKTELARSLARLLFGDEKRLVRFDMSEYMEPHSVAKLIGAPPGYVGHEQEGLLVSAVRYSPRLRGALRRDREGASTGVRSVPPDLRRRAPHRRTRETRRTSATPSSSSPPTSSSAKRDLPTPLGFKSEPPPPQAPVDLRFALSHYLRPELVNRIDEIILFHSLGTDTPEGSSSIAMSRACAKLAPGHPRIEMAEPVYEFLIAHGAS